MVEDVEKVEVIDETTEEDMDVIIVLCHISLKGIKA